MFQDDMASLEDNTMHSFQFNGMELLDLDWLLFLLSSL